MILPTPSSPHAAPADPPTNPPTNPPVDLLAWLALLSCPGVGRQTARQLLQHFGGPQAVLDAAAGRSAHALKGLGSGSLSALRTLSASVFEAHERTQRWLRSNPRAAVITLKDPRYPPSLRESADAPLLLYALGRSELLQRPSLAIVGSRSATPHGLATAQEFARHLSERGLTIVSGLALGIDAAAHQGALPHPGSTIAVVGTGLDLCYPQRHLALAQRISEEGLLLSEYPLGMPALRDHFPQRNRVIAGLCAGTLVIEATVGSGSLITARLALESGREVFAVPGSILSPQSRGCHSLIRQGALLVEHPEDVLQDLQPTWPSEPLGPGSSTVPENALDISEYSHISTELLCALDLMGHAPCTLDTLSERSGHSPAEMATHMLQGELLGLIGRLPGGRFQRVA